MAVIRHRLDLVVRCLDAATGSPIGDSDTLFRKDGESFRMAAKGGGIFYLTGIERVSFRLRIDIQGYEAKEVYVDYDELDERIPELELFFLPKKALSLEGVLPGITDIRAVDEGSSNWFISSYNAKKQTIQLFNRHQLRVQHFHYGVIDAETGEFECFDVVGESAIETVTLKAPLQKEPRTNAPIARLIPGEVFEDGRYILRVPDDGANQNYIVRFVVNGESYFQKIDFNNLSENMLIAEAKNEVPQENETEVEAK